MHIRKTRIQSFQIGLLLILNTAISPLLAQVPVVAGFERSSGTSNPSDLGELLLGELNCLSCHTATDDVAVRIWTKQAPDLSEAGKRLTPQFLQKYLSDPDSVKPGTTMPDLFHASETQSKQGAIDFLVHFLASRGGPTLPSRAGGTTKQVETGKKLFHQIGCVACHGPEEGDSTLPRIPLGNLALKTTVDALTEFLLDPHRIRPTGRMPNLWLSKEEAAALAVYLLREQLDNPLSQAGKKPRTSGLDYAYYELEAPQALPDFASLTPTAKGGVAEITLDLPTGHRANNYAIRFSGELEITTAGRYTFRTLSDDGSRLWVDGNLIVDNDGIHGTQMRSGRVELTEGEHRLEIGFFDGGGGDALQVLWNGPGIEGRRQPIPSGSLWRSGGDPMIPLEQRDFVVDQAKAQMGARMFSALRCVSCHALDNLKPMVPAPALAGLNLDSPTGCLGTEIRKGLPKYDLSDAQRTALKTALRNRNGLAQAISPKETVHKTLATFNCYACHQRDGFGGPDDSLASTYFGVLNAIDLGEEGKIPPRLDGVGSKLKPEALENILSSRQLHIRSHYMATRMPGFGLKNLAPFTRSIAPADQTSSKRPEHPFTVEAATAGRQFVGARGLSCIACHRVAGQNGVGIQGIDLATTFDRLTPDWFERYLLNPAIFKPGTRMPSFWPDGMSLFPDLLGGDTGRQIAAIWSYLSLKDSMPFPEGIIPEGTVAMELVPSDSPIVHRTFMKDVGPRTVLAGYPEKLNIAFDANQVRLAKAWRGRFFDQSGAASGRTDAFLEPLGEAILDLPPGPAFAFLTSDDQPWPIGDKSSRDLGGHFAGYTLNTERRPVLAYELQGVRIEETPRPILQPGGSILARQFRLHPGGGTRMLTFLAAAGETIEKTASGSYRVNGTLETTMTLPSGITPTIRRQNGRAELLVPIALNQATVEFEQIIRW